jgi:hypothetical protein
MSQETSNIDRVMQEIGDLGYGTEEYHEAMWMLLSVMARRQAIMADHIRRMRLQKEARERRKAEVKKRV